KFCYKCCEEDTSSQCPIHHKPSTSTPDDTPQLPETSVKEKELVNDDNNPLYIESESIEDLEKEAESSALNSGDTTAEVMEYMLRVLRMEGINPPIIEQICTQINTEQGITSHEPVLEELRKYALINSRSTTGKIDHTYRGIINGFKAHNGFYHRACEICTS